MPPYSSHLMIGFLALLVTGALHLITLNRLIKRKLRFSALLFVCYILLNLVLPQLRITVEALALWNSVAQLVFALGLINLFVSVAINPLRVDRVPESFPNIVQDALIVGTFGVVGTAVLGEKFLTTSAIGAVVVGFALQDTLGNAFAGLAIQIEKPFHVGHWIRVGEFEGQVAEITWRATKLRTKSGNLVIVPNNIVSKEAIANYSEPVQPTRLTISVGVSYDTPPNEVKDAILEGIVSSPLTLRSPKPDVILVDFGNSAVVYQGRFWIADFKDDDTAMDQVRSGIYYVLKRRRIDIPYPIQTEISIEPPPPGRSEAKNVELLAHVAKVNVFAAFTDSEREALVNAAIEQLYAAGETVVREGDPGGSMFIVCSGKMRVMLRVDERQVAALGPGDYFGEMSLLTGEERTATVIAITDAVVLQITAEAFRRIVTVNPTVVERIGLEVISRQHELEEARRAAPSRAVAAADGAAGFLARVRRFLQLPGW